MIHHKGQATDFWIGDRPDVERVDRSLEEHLKKYKAMTYRTLPSKFLDRIKREIEQIPVHEGKVILTLEFSSGTGGILKEMEVKKFIHDRERL